MQIFLMEVISQVVSEFVRICFDSMSADTGAVVRSMFDPVVPALTAIGMLCKADKRYAQEVAISPHFQLDPAKASSPRVQNLSMHMMHPRFVEQTGVAGAALEHHTLVGRILRVAPTQHDPQLISMLGDCFKKPKNVVDGHISTIRGQVTMAQSCAYDVLFSLLKGGGVGKDSAVLWLTQMLALNREAEKDQPSPMIASSPGFMLNAGGLCLLLSKPVVTDINRLKKVDWNYLQSSESEEVFPRDATRLMPKSSGWGGASGDGCGGDGISASRTSSASSTASSSSSSAGEKVTFITQSFFISWRALHLGFVQRCNGYERLQRTLNYYYSGLETGDPQSIGVLVEKVYTDAVLLHPSLLSDVVGFVSAACTSLMLALEPELSAAASLPGTTSEEKWQLAEEDLTPRQRAVLSSLPEHLIDDLLTILLTVGKTEPAPLALHDLESVVSALLFFLRRPWAVQSPHMRAKFGVVLFQVFLPCCERKKHDMLTSTIPTDGPHSSLLARHVEAQRFLAPALLLLYGDVERTGFYDKLQNRRSIMIVLKHLWTLPTHRQAFRGIASMGPSTSTEIPASASAAPSSSVASGVGSSSAAGSGGVLGDASASLVMGEGEEVNYYASDSSENYFIRFANGLLNETNALVTSTMEKLGEIRKAQLLMKSQEWHTMGHEAQQQTRERLDEHENSVKLYSGLCQETLNMINYLTSDEAIRPPFLMNQILPRFASMLLSVLTKLVGSKGLEIKVENMESYNFDPRLLLREVCQAMTHFTEFSEFAQALAGDGFYDGGDPIKKAIATVAKLRLLPLEEEASLRALFDSTLRAKATLQVCVCVASNLLWSSIISYMNIFGGVRKKCATESDCDLEYQYISISVMFSESKIFFCRAHILPITDRILTI